MASGNIVIQDDKKLRSKLEVFVSSAQSLFDGTGVEFKEYCRTTDQLFLRVGPLFTEKHRRAIERYIQDFYPKTYVSLYKKED